MSLEIMFFITLTSIIFVFKRPEAQERVLRLLTRLRAKKVVLRCFRHLIRLLGRRMNQSQWISQHITTWDKSTPRLGFQHASPVFEQFKSERTSGGEAAVHKKSNTRFVNLFMIISTPHLSWPALIYT